MRSAVRLANGASATSDAPVGRSDGAQPLAMPPPPATTGTSRFRVTGAAPGSVKGGVTFRHQPSLPPLPVPPLRDTLARWLATAEALAESDEEVDAARTAVEEFLAPTGMGPVLQARLQRHAERCHAEGRGWLIDWWNKWSYMAWRLPVVINVSYFYHFAPDPRGARFNTQVARAASLISAAVDFRDLLVREALPADSMGRGNKAKALCMSMYRFLFNTARLPRSGEDACAMFEPEEHKHVLIIRKRRFFTFDAFAGTRRLTVEELERQVQRVIDLAGDDHGPAIGALTSGERDEVVHAGFVELEAASLSNAEALRAIRSSMFAVCLDDDAPMGRAERARKYMHGDGRNRWYDKTLQFIVSADGDAGFMGEHSMSDGMPTATMTNWMLEGIAKGERAVLSGVAAGDALPDPEEAVFELSPRVFEMIDTAVEAHEAACADHEVEVFDYEQFGRDALKGFKVSPDAFTQMAFQLAYRRTFGRSRGTYEPAHTRSFLNGRTACIRGYGPEAKAFVDCFEKAGTTAKEKAARLRDAITAHSKKTGEAVRGLDCDRHLLGLKLVRQPGEEHACKLFDLPIFARTSYWAISTSNLTSEHYANWGWGEVVPDGLGIAYSTKRKRLTFNVVCRKGVGAANFARQLRWAISDMADVLRGGPRARL